MTRKTVITVSQENAGQSSWGNASRWKMITEKISLLKLLLHQVGFLEMLQRVTLIWILIEQQLNWNFHTAIRGRTWRRWNSSCWRRRRIPPCYPCSLTSKCQFPCPPCWHCPPGGEEGELRGGGGHRVPAGARPGCLTLLNWAVYQIHKQT